MAQEGRLIMPSAASTPLQSSPNSPRPNPTRPYSVRHYSARHFAAIAAAAAAPSLRSPGRLGSQRPLGYAHDHPRLGRNRELSGRRRRGHRLRRRQRAAGRRDRVRAGPQDRHRAQPDRPGANRRCRGDVGRRQATQRPGQIVGPEDASFGDVDDDGAMDVVVASQGGLQGHRVLRARRSLDVDDPAAWSRWTSRSRSSRNESAMRVQLADLDDDGDSEIVVGAQEFNRDAGARVLQLTDTDDWATAGPTP